jgi:Flp pilus assembly protein TadG
MTYSPDSGKETGTIFVEAALVMPLLLLVCFASIYFFMAAARNYAVQMVANDIARAASLSLSQETLKSGGCIAMCRQQTVGSGIETVDIQQFLGSYNNCFKKCASSQYLLSENFVSIAVTPIPDFSSLAVAPQQTTNLLSPGDMVRVNVSYPVSAVLGATIPMFGSWAGNLQGSSVGIIEKP